MAFRRVNSALASASPLVYFVTQASGFANRAPSVAARRAMSDWLRDIGAEDRGDAGA